MKTWAEFETWCMDTSRFGDEKFPPPLPLTDLEERLNNEAIQDAKKTK